MKKNNPCEQLIRIEHQWTEEHVRAYLKDQYNYTIHLHTGSIIREATFHYCHLFKKHYFAVGTSVILIEDVYSHSMKGHPAPPEPEPVPLKPNPDCLAICDEVDEVVDVITTPDINPNVFRRRVKCLMISGMTQAEAEKYATDNPMQLSLFYDIGRGGFAVDAEAVGNTPIYNPYTGKEIPEKTE